MHIYIHIYSFNQYKIIIMAGIIVAFKVVFIYYYEIYSLSL